MVQVAGKQPLAKALGDILNEATQAGVFTHAYAACGAIDHDALDLRAVLGTPQDCFDLASLTKALVTVPTVFSLAAQDAGVSFHAPLRQLLVSSYKMLPEALHGTALALLIQHRSGLPPWDSFWISCEDFASGKITPAHQVLKRVKFRIGESGAGLGKRGEFVYSDIGYILLGFGLQELVQKNLAELFKQVCVDRLNMAEELLYFNPGSQRSCVSSGYCPVRQRELVGEVHDENAWFLGGIAGHAGAFATGDDLCRYLRVLVRSELGEQIVAANAALRKPGDNRGLYGWQQGSFGGGQGFGGGKAMGHLGFTGTAFWYLPESRYYGVLLTNRVVNGRTSNLQAIAEVRQKVFSLFSRCLA